MGLLVILNQQRDNSPRPSFGFIGIIFSFSNGFSRKSCKKWNCFLIEWLNPAELGLKFVYTSNMFHKMKANRKIFGCHGENEKVVRLACLIAFVPSAQENLFLKLWINSLRASSVESKIILDINWENPKRGVNQGRITMLPLKKDVHSSQLEWQDDQMQSEFVASAPFLISTLITTNSEQNESVYWMLSWLSFKY